MQQWEYQVIHLNVDTSTPGKDGSTPPSPDAPTTPPPFTKTYLEQEFPAHYGPQQPPGSSVPAPAQQPQHPAAQLQGFINGHGRKGWELLGIFPLGSLLMMIFRRPLPPQEEASVALGRAVAEASDAAVLEAATTEPTTGASLQSILERLAALEQRFAATPSPSPNRRQAPPLAPAPQPSPRGPSDRQADGTWILDPKQLQALDHHTPCSTAEAARSLGFRSAASLLNQAAKHGYPIGLVRMGLNGRAAVYQGLGANRRGGRELRLWLVLESEALPVPPG